MHYLGLLSLLALVFLNLWGMALVAGLIWKNRWVACMAAPWVFVTVCFGVETFHGFGPRLGVLTFAGTLLSLGLIWLSGSTWIPANVRASWATRLDAWRAEMNPRALRSCGVVFIVVFAYALAWRMLRPEIDGSSEKIPDLAMIASYLPGGTIPVADVWLHPYPFIQYYSFQHYAGALLGRLLHLEPGVCYNLAFCTLVALTGFTFAGAVVLLTQSRWKQVLLTFALIVGGTGTSGVAHLVYQDPQPWHTMRFIGGTPFDSDPWGKRLQEYAARYPRHELPGEPFSYDVFLGDYHAPISGFCLLGLGVAAAAYWQRSRSRAAVALLGGTVTWTILAHAWIFPLHSLAIAGWLLWNVRSWRDLLPWLIGGVAVVWLAAFFYLQPFLAASVNYNNKLRVVSELQRTPPLLHVLYWLPFLGLTAASFYSRWKPGIFMGVMAILLLGITEFTFIDDIYVIEYERFNTTLKWWPWVGTLILLVLGSTLLEHATRRWVRVVALLFCLHTCLFAYDLGRNLYHSRLDDFGKLHGHAFLDRDEGSRLILARLKREPRGVVIERPVKESFTTSACLPLFAGHAMWMGWMGHQQLWRGYPEFLPQRFDTLEQFFKGETGRGGEWLKSEGIDYVLWYQAEDTNERWDRVHAAIHEGYRWHQILVRADGRKVGFWRRVGFAPGD